MFDLFVDTLATEMANTGIGVKFGGELVNILLYADDVVLIGENAEQLQTLLNHLDTWCKKWRLSLNQDKTSVIVFRTRNTAIPQVQFTCGNLHLNIVSQYKYLGLTLNQYLDWDMTVKVLANSAHRALGVIIAKHKRFGGMPFKAFTAAYDSMVRPILEYGTEIWGHKDYKCINNVYLRASRAFPGVGRYSPNNAVIGDIGWTPPVVRQKSAMIKWWCKLVRMRPNRLTRHIFEACFYHSEKSRNNWCYRCVKLIHYIDGF